MELLLLSLRPVNGREGAAFRKGIEINVRFSSET
jgi:hypothetical protein